MIIDAILLIFEGIINILLSPLSVLSLGIDFVTSIPVINSFISVIAYVLPWSNILPIIIFIVSEFGFRAIMAVIRLVKSFIPLWGN